MTNNDYELYVLIGSKWHFIERCYTIKEVNISINYIYETYPDKAVQIICNNKEFYTLDGSDFQKFMFYNKYVLKQPEYFDYVKEYEKQKKF